MFPMIEKISRQLQRVWEDKHCKKGVLVAATDVQAELFQKILQNKPVAREETFSQTFLKNHVE